MASYPSAVASFSTKVDGVTTVIAADPNLIQDEVVAIENILGTNPHQSTLASVGSYVSSPTSTTFGSVTARIANIESGLVTALSTTSTNGSALTALTTRVGTAETNITSLTSRMTAAETVNTTQTSNISTANTNITNLTTRMTAAETALAGVATDTNLTALTGRVTTLESTTSSQGTTISSHTSSISSINSTLTGYTTSITTGALTISAASTSTPVGVTITQSTNANSKRAAIQLGSGWVVGQDSSTSTSGGVKDFFIYDATASAYRLKIGTDGIISTISSLKLRPGTATAGTAPLYFDTVSPVLLTSPVAGAMEYDGTNLYFTPSGVSRKTVAYLDSSITGNAATATTLATSRNINGVAFNGSSAITIKASTTNTLGLTDSNLAFSTGTTWDGGTAGITIGLSATPTGITSINGISVTGSSGSFLTSASTASVLTSVGTLNKLTIASSAGGANPPPLKLTLGSNTTTAQAGAMEYDGTNLYFTPNNTTPVRKTVSYVGDAGYTQLYQTTINSTGTDYSANISVSDYTYRKLVVTIEVTAYTSGGATKIKVNSSGSTFFGYDYTRILYSNGTNVGTMDGAYQGNAGFQLGTASGITSFYTIEFPNYWSANGWKHITSQGTGVSLVGVAEDTSRISNLYLLTTGTFTYTLTVYGVK